MKWNAGTVRKLEEITETVAIPQMERIDGQTASSFLLLIIKSSAFSSFAERELVSNSKSKRQRRLEK
jgi:hypothetical protein